jgi:hypothetical protein
LPLGENGALGSRILSRILQHRQNGHAPIETTVIHYTHKVDSDDKNATEAIGAMLSPTVELVN